MATLAELITRERKSGSSKTGSLFSAVGKKTLETIDPRRMFNQSGVLTALFPSLKSYKAGAESSKVDSASKELSGSTAPILEQVVTKLDGLDMTMRLVAKNTMTMPGMSRDMNIMRQNVVKLVRLQGGKASTKADAFFLRAFERERATESELQAAKERRASGTTKTSTALKEKISGIPLIGSIITAITAPFLNIGKKLETFFDNFITGIGGFFSTKGISGLFGNILRSMSSVLGKFGPGFLKAASGIGASGFLGIGALAALFYGMYKLFTSEATQYGGPAPSTFDPELGIAPQSFGDERPATKEEIERARETVRRELESKEQLKSAVDKIPGPTPAMPTSPTPATGTSAPASASTSATPATAATTAESTSPRLVPSLPSSELGGVEYASYAQTIGKRESNGDYKAINTLGYLGKYQFGAMALEDMGLVKKGVGKKGQKALDDPSNWTIEGGKDAFLNNPTLQEQTMLRYTKMNFNRLKQLGVINSETTAEKIAGFLASAHLVGPGGAAAMSRGEIKKDAYGTTAQSYFNLGLASQSGIGPVPSSSGSQIALASSTVDSARMDAMAPSAIIPAMANLTAPKTPSLQKQQVNIPSTVDTDLYEGLVARITEYA
jgi:hypothetical protein